MARAVALALLLPLTVAVPGAVALNIPADTPASLVLGAPDFTSAVKGDAARMTYAFERPMAVHRDSSGRIFVADVNNARIAGFNALPGSNGAAFDYVVGSSSLSDYRNGCTTTMLRGPHDIETGGGRMAIADTSGNRVNLYNSIPSSSGAASSIALGQVDRSSCSSSSVSASSLDSPRGVWTNGTKLIVADTDAERVLIWNTWPTVDGQPADLVLGQPNMTSSTANNGGRSASSLDSPNDVWSNGTKILVADTTNDRVLVWNSWPTSSGEAADYVIGQPNMTDKYAGCETDPGYVTRRLDHPTGVYSNGTRIVISDASQHRVLVYDSWPTSNDPTPSWVLGQPTFSDCKQNRNGAVGAGTMARPGGVWTDGTRIAVADTGNHRVLWWGSWPSANGVSPTRVLGHPDFTRAGPNDMGLDSIFSSVVFTNVYSYSITTANEHGSQWPAIGPSGRLWVAETTHNRVTYHTTAPAANGEAPDWLFGQDLATDAQCNTSNGAVSATSLCHPAGIWTDGTKLLVADTANNRVKGWNSYPASANAPPDFVLGQPDFVSNSLSTTQAGMYEPFGVASDGTRVAVTDFDNHRVLLWDSWPTASGQPADRVLGQPDFTSSTYNNGGRSASSLNRPTGIDMEQGVLAVADQANHRVLVWNSWPTANNQPADGVFGATSFTASGTGFSYPKGVALAGNALAVTTSCDVVYVDPVPTSGAVENPSVQLADGCWLSPTDIRVDTPIGIDAKDGHIWVDDAGHARLLRWGDTLAPTITVAPTVTTGCSGTTVTWTTDESATSELYFDTVSRASWSAYTYSSTSTELAGPTHSRSISGVAAGTYYYRVRNVDWAGQEVVSAEGTFTVPSPTITDNQAGDTTWRGVNGGSYDVDFCDGMGLDRFEVRVWTGTGQTGTMLIGWTQVSTLSGTSHTGNWSLPSAVWDAMQVGTNYVSVRVWSSGGSSRTRSDAFYVLKDVQQPSSPGPVNDGSGADIDAQASTSELDANWAVATDSHSGLQRYDYCIATAAGCGGTVVVGWTSSGTSTSMSETGLSLTSGQTYYVAVRSVDMVGNVTVASSDGIVVGLNVTGISPSSAPQGRTSLAVTVTGAGFQAGAGVSFSGSGITVDSATRVSDTQIDAVISISGAAATGARDVIVSNPDASSATLASGFTVTAPMLSLGLSTLGYGDAARDGTAPHAISFGALLPGSVREIGPSGSGQQLAGAAVEMTVSSNTDYVLQVQSTSWSDGGTETIAAGQLAHKHHGVAEAWVPFTTSAATIEGPSAPTGSASYAYDLQLGVPAAQRAGSYTATVTYTLAAAP